MEDKTYQNIRGKFMAKWRVEPFSAARKAVETISSIYPDLSERLFISEGDHILNGTNLSVSEASLIEEAFQSSCSTVVYTCNAFADSERSAAPAMSMPSYAKRNSMINSNDVVITPTAFEKLGVALESNAAKIIASKPHQFNAESIKRLDFQSVAFSPEAVSDSTALQERRFISSSTLNENRITIQDNTRVIIAVTAPSGQVFPIEEATAVTSPEENRIVVSGINNNFNKLPGDAVEYREEIKNLVFERHEARLCVRPFDLACEAMKEIDPEEKFHGASKMRGEIDIWGGLAEQATTIIEGLRTRGIKVIAAKGCPGFQADSINEVDSNLRSAWTPKR